jgi:hypothetical protein
MTATIEELITALSVWEKHRAAEDALVQMGLPAVEPLIATLKDGRGGANIAAAAETLGRIGDARAVEPLIAALNGVELYVRIKAAEALGQIGDAHAVKPLTAAFNDSNEKLRSAAGKALEKIGGPGVEEAVANHQKKESTPPANKASVSYATEPRASEEYSAENGRGAKTTDPLRALELLFGWALPAAPVMPLDEIHAMYNFLKNSLGSEYLLEDGLEDVISKWVLKTLKTLQQRRDFQTYRVEIDLKGLGKRGDNGIPEKRKCAVVRINFGSTYACIFVLRSESKVFAFGTPHLYAVD